MPVGLKDMGRKEVKYASFGGSGTTTIVAAVTGKKINVIAYAVTVTQASTVTFKSDTTAITGAMNMGIVGGMGVSDTINALVAGWNPDGYFETAVGEALKITDSAGTASGHVTYIETT